MTVTLDPIWTSLATLIALFVGSRLKASPDFANKLSPYVTLLITFLGQVISAATAHAGVFGDIKSVAVGVVVQTILVWLSTTGAYSYVKNSIKGKTSDGK